MSEFLEEKISIDIRYDSAWQDDYAVEITQTGGSTDTKASEYRRLVHPYPIRRFSVSYQKDLQILHDEIINLYHRAYGKFAGFRAKAADDYSTNGLKGVPTAFDQDMLLVSAGIYQLQKKYGTDKASLAVGYPIRTIFKPVAGSVRVSIGAVEVPITAQWTVSTITGRVTFVANKTDTITGITKASQAVVTVGSHTFNVNETVHFTGVGGMAQINGLRGTITATGGTTITVAIDSTTFGTYTSGGTVNTNPQSGETVKAGCEFDVPVRFDSAVPVSQNHHTSRYVSFDLVELLNP